MIETLFRRHQEWFLSQLQTHISSLKYIRFEWELADFSDEMEEEFQHVISSIYPTREKTKQSVQEQEVR